MDSNWDLAQKLIERDVLSLDQAREAISIQEKLGEGASAFPELLLERGYVTSAQLGAAGIQVKPRPKPARSTPPPQRTGMTAVLLFGVAGILCLVALVIVFGGDVAGALFSGGPADPEEEGPGAAELAAKRAKAELKAIIQLEASDLEFEKARSVVRRYEAYQRGQSGKKGELEAQQRLVSYVARLEAII